MAPPTGKETPVRTYASAMIGPLAPHGPQQPHGAARPSVETARTRGGGTKGAAADGGGAARRDRWRPALSRYRRPMGKLRALAARNAQAPRPRPCGCCGPWGANGPIMAEAYVRTGVSFPVGGAIFSKTLDNGWASRAACARCFSTRAKDAAWVVRTRHYQHLQPRHHQRLGRRVVQHFGNIPSPIAGGAPTTVVVPNWTSP